MDLWRTLFGPGQDEIWGRVAEDIRADYTPGGWLKRGRIDLVRPEAIIALDTYEQSDGENGQIYTRMRAPFSNRNGLAMHIYREGIFSGLGRLAGMQDIIVGDGYFDRAFVIQGQPEQAIIAFLQDARLRTLIAYQTDIRFRIRRDDGWFVRHYPDGIHELYCECRGFLKDEMALKRLFELFTVAIDALARVDPGCRFGVGIAPSA